VIQRQTNGVQQGGFPRTGWAGNGKQPVAGERLAGEINLPFAFL